MVALIIIVANVVIGVISYRTSSSSLTNAANEKIEQIKIQSETLQEANQAAEGNKVILEEVRVLQDTTGEMKSSMEEMSDGALKINETEQSLELISRHMKDTLFFISGFRCIRGSASTRQVP